MRAASARGVRVRVQVRPARLSDLPSLERFISGYTGDGTLLPRSRANLVAHLRDFRVAVDPGGALVGCGALQIVDETLAEVRSVAVDPAWRGRGVGGRLVRALLAEARRLGLPRVFCLTRRVEFFARAGFVEVTKERFPHKVWNDCRLCPRRECCDEIAMERPVTAVRRSRRAPADAGLPALPESRAALPLLHVAVAKS